jgi:hypothetical protein
VSSLVSLREMEAAISQRRGNIGRAEEFVRSTFGPETLNFMTKLRDEASGSPAFMLARQIAKPEMRHAALYLTAKSLGYKLVTLEWATDFLQMGSNGYKRYCVDIPFGYLGNKNDLVARHVNLIKGTPAAAAPDCKIRLCDIEVPASTVAILRTHLQRSMCGELAAALEDKNYGLQEFHSLLRGKIEGTDQTVADASAFGGEAMAGLTELYNHVPGLQAGHLGGEFMYLLLFALQNVAPNLVLAESDWNKDDEKLRRRYESVVGFLRANGLNEPLQFIMPPLHESLALPIKGTDAKLDRMVPAKSGICGLARLEPSDQIDRTFLESGRSILDALRAAKR